MSCIPSFRLLYPIKLEGNIFFTACIVYGYNIECTESVHTRPAATFWFGYPIVDRISRLPQKRAGRTEPFSISHVSHSVSLKTKSWVASSFGELLVDDWTFAQLTYYAALRCRSLVHFCLLLIVLDAFCWRIGYRGIHAGYVARCNPEQANTTAVCLGTAVDHYCSQVCSPWRCPLLLSWT